MAALTWERTKDPDETVDYGVNWAPQLGEEEIASSTWIVPDGLTKVSDSATTTTTTIRLSSGTIGETYELVNRVTTDGGQIYDQTCKLKLRVR